MAISESHCATVSATVLKFLLQKPAPKKCLKIPVWIRTVLWIKNQMEMDASLRICYLGTLKDSLLCHMGFCAVSVSTDKTIRFVETQYCWISSLGRACPQNLQLWCQQYFRCCHIKNVLRSHWTLIVSHVRCLYLICDMFLIFSLSQQSIGSEAGWWWSHAVE